MSGTSHYYEQPGLEVADSRPQAGLEVALPSSSWLHTVPIQEGKHSSAPLPEKKRNVKKIILIAAGCLVIIIAVVVGVVVGVVTKHGSDTTITKYVNVVPRTFSLSNIILAIARMRPQ